MAWPPTIPPATRTNSTPQLDAHPSDHNAISAALSAIVARIGIQAYAEQTSDVNVTALTAGAAQTVITSPAVALDGTPVLIEYSCPFVITPAVSGGQCYCSLWDGSTDLGYIGGTQIAGGVGGAPFLVRKRLTPAAGNHTFTVRAFVGPSGTGRFTGGAGSAAGVWNPAVITVRYA